MPEKNLLWIVLIVCLILFIYVFSSNSTPYCKVTVRYVNTLPKPVVVSWTNANIYTCLWWADNQHKGAPNNSALSNATLLLGTPSDCQNLSWNNSFKRTHLQRGTFTRLSLSNIMIHSVEWQGIHLSGFWNYLLERGGSFKTMSFQPAACC